MSKSCHFTMLQTFSKCEVKAAWCWNLQSYCHSNFTWNQILGRSKDEKCNIEVLNLNFSQFEPFLEFQNDQNSKLRVSEIVKLAIFEIQILPKLISRKIEWKINSCIKDFSFTFWKFLEHSAYYFLDTVWLIYYFYKSFEWGSKEISLLKHFTVDSTLR